MDKEIERRMLQKVIRTRRDASLPLAKLIDRQNLSTDDVNAILNSMDAYEKYIAFVQGNDGN